MKTNHQEDRVLDEALAVGRAIKESGRLRVESTRGTMWAVTRGATTKDWALYVPGLSRQIRVGTLTTRSREAVKAALDALEPFHAVEALVP